MLWSTAAIIRLVGSGLVLGVLMVDDKLRVQAHHWSAACDEERIGGGQLGPLKQAVQWSQAATRTCVAFVKGGDSAGTLLLAAAARAGVPAGAHRAGCTAWATQQISRKIRLRAFSGVCDKWWPGRPPEDINVDV